jgi:glycerol-3-phosphate dehydrogenase (NAD(P)+)
MARIGIVGLGNWGTALAKIWIADGHNVSGWTVEHEVYQSLMENSLNSKYLPGHDLSGLQATMELSDIMETCELIIMALPSSVILSVFDDIVKYLRPSHVIVDLAKGLAPENEKSGLISEVLEKKLSAAGKNNPVVVMTGPTIAPEVARGVLTNALVACHDRSVAERVSERLSTSSLVLTPAIDPIGAELWGAYKNTVALACGLVDGLRNSIGGDNLKAALVLAGYSEGIFLLERMGAQKNTAFGPAGIGDLFVTATSQSSRNRSLGEKLGSGMSLDEALDEMFMVAEGVRATKSFLDQASKLEVETPFLSSLWSLLEGELEVEEAVRKMVESYRS